jgi:hypothetical protein
MSRAHEGTGDRGSPAAEGGERTPAGPQAGGADEKPVPSWPGAVLLFLLITCCLLPVFLVALGDWLAQEGFAWPAPRRLVLIGVVLFAAWALRRSYRQSQARGRGANRS